MAYPDPKCPRCKGDGMISRKATSLGYLRMPQWDENGRAGWLTPSGLKMTVSPSGEDFPLETLCNCVRKQLRGVKLVEQIGA